MAHTATSATIPSTIQITLSSSSLLPVGAYGAEHPEDERVVQRLHLMCNAGFDVQQFAVAKRHFVARDEQLQCALQHVRHLLAVVCVLRHDRTSLQVHLRNGFAFARHEFSRHHFGDLLECDFVPAKQTIRLHFLSFLRSLSLASTAPGRDYTTRTD